MLPESFSELAAVQAAFTNENQLVALPECLNQLVAMLALRINTFQLMAFSGSSTGRYVVDLVRLRTLV